MTDFTIPRRTIEHFHAVAARKAGQEGWEPFAYERLGDALLMKGGVPRLLQSGPRKGEKTWEVKSATKVVVTDEEADEEARRQSEALATTEK